MQAKLGRSEPRWQRRKEVRPQEIVEAALQLFVKQGFAATKVDQVAKIAGVTPGTLYVYFANKEALLRAVVQQSMVPIFAYADEQIDEYDGPAAGLMRKLMREWWEQIGAGRFAGIPKLMVAEAQNFPELARFYAVEVQERGREVIRRVLEYGVAKGEFVIPDIEVTVRLIMAPLQFATIYAHSLAPYDTGIGDIDAYLDGLADLVLYGVSKKKR